MIRIGVTGHRFLADIPKLQAGIDLALARIAQAYPGEAWAVVSSLAEGADRLVVQRVLHARPEARLVVPLPLPVSDYLQDFRTEMSKAEFHSLLARAVEVLPPPQVALRSQGYWQAGLRMLAYSDVLVALWDGQKAQGQGGAGDVVAMARGKGLPLAWVKCGNRKPGTEEATSLGDEQGQVNLEGIN